MLDQERWRAKEVHQKMGAAFRRVAWDHTAIIVTNQGRDMVAIIAMDEYRAYVAWREERDEHLDTTNGLRSALDLPRHLRRTP